MNTTAQKLTTVFDTLKGEFGYTNKLAAPKLSKIVISSGTGKKGRFEKGIHDLVADRLGKITGQKPSARSSKKSIAGFKMRAGDNVGQVVTLRGKNMITFFDKLVHIALPRTKDFRGLTRTAIDDMGNLTIGIKEHTIFPETADEDLRDVFGFAITIVTTAKSKAEADALLTFLGVPFKK
jgi:large subunit ribosomal protein L5